MASISTLTDDFTAGTEPDAGKWVNESWSENQDWSINSGSLALHSEGDWVSASLLSADTYTLIGGAIYFRVNTINCVGGPPEGNGAQVSLLLSDGLSGWDACGWEVLHDEAGKKARVGITGSDPAIRVAHAAANRYRIREAGGKIVWDYSSNGATWKTVHTSSVLSVLPEGGVNVSVRLFGDLPEGVESDLRVSAVNA